MGRKDIEGTLTKPNTSRVVHILKHSTLYKVLPRLTRGETTLLNYILKYMYDNLIIMAGDEVYRCMYETGLSKTTIPSTLTRLRGIGYIDKTALANEWVVHPTFALSGYESTTYQLIERLENELREEKEFKN